jgi:hypothetical protein
LRLVVLSTGETLGDGDVSSAGVTIHRVQADGAWFRWGDKTKFLRKGDSSSRSSHPGTVP